MTAVFARSPGPPKRDLDRYLAAGLGRADTDRRAVPREHDRVGSDMADRPPGEQEVVQLVERRPPIRDDLEPAAIEPELVEALDEEAARDPLEVEIGDAVVAHALGRIRRDGEDLEAGLRLEDADRRLAVARRDDGLVRVRGDLAGGRPVELPVDSDDPAERRDRIGLEGMPVGLDQLVRGREPDRVGVLDDRDGRRRVVGRDPVGRVEVHAGC